MLKRTRNIGLLESIVILLTSSTLVIFLVWLGTLLGGGSVLAAGLPSFISNPISGLFTWLTTGGAAAVVARTLKGNAPESGGRNYLVWIGGTTIGMLAIVFLIPRIVTQPVAVKPPDGQFFLKFKVEFADVGPTAPLPTLQFREEKPEHWYGDNVLYIPPVKGSYTATAQLPDLGMEYQAELQRDRTGDGAVSSDDITPAALGLCFGRQPRDPPRAAPFNAALLCKWGEKCSIDGDDPGWAAECVSKAALGSGFPSLRFFSLPVVKAESTSDGGKPEAGWIIPSLKTLKKLHDDKKIGFTDFTIDGGPIAVPNADSFTYRLWVNDVPVSVDGWKSEELRAPLDATKGIHLEFGLENLDFSGVHDGCDTIDAQIDIFGRNSKLRTLRVYRQYAALRSAEQIDIPLDGGLSLHWKGAFLPPPQGENTEVFILSGSLSSIQALKEKMNVLPKLKFTDGEEIATLIRPPRTNSSYGLAVGLRQSTGQLRFLFDDETARKFIDWAASPPIARRFGLTQPASPYTVLGDRSATFKPCHNGGPRP